MFVFVVYEYMEKVEKYIKMGKNGFAKKNFFFSLPFPNKH